MVDCMQKLKAFLSDLDIAIIDEDPEEDLLIVDDQDSGVTNLILDCEDPILIVEQVIMPVPAGAGVDFYRRLLQMNATLVHGAFLLDEEAGHVFYRDTLQLENLDKNELEASIRALALALAEHGDELLEMSKQA